MKKKDLKSEKDDIEKNNNEEDNEKDNEEDNEEDKDTYLLKLYVAGKTPNCLKAFANLQEICKKHLGDQYKIEVIDLLENPKLAKGDQIIAIPTLVRKLPTPIKKIIGNLADEERVLVGLDIKKSIH
ncbi:MAG: circadian clock KaiB family protein [Oligoflexia bacterium]|nr:circadian clock KaiB family protein [Oligoflexia bacterium]